MTTIRTTTRAQHLEWCKARSLAELDSDADGKATQRAVARMTTDLLDHADTRALGNTATTPQLIKHAVAGDRAAVREWIEGLR